MSNVFDIEVETTRILKEKAVAKLASVNATFEDFPFIDPANFNNFGAGVAAVLIQYNTITAGAIIPAPFKRFRLFSVREDITRRYHQEANSQADIYIPAPLNLESFFNPQEPLYITEGELKAHYMCTLGWPAVALPGVDMFKLPTNELFKGLELLPQDKPVVIVFDSEVRYEYNDGVRSETAAYTNVQSALRRLAAALHIRGHATSYISLGDGKAKVQVDDWLRDNGTLPAPLRVESQYDLATLQSEWFLYDGTPHKAESLRAMRYSNWCVQFAHHKHSDKQAVQVFKMNKHTIKVNEIRLDPTTTKRFVYTGGAAYYNMFRGWETKAVKGDISPMLEVWKAIFRDDVIAFDEYIKTVAFMLQRPWVKQQRFIIMRGSAEGVGKSFLLELPIKLIGKTHAKILTCGRVLESDFNDELQGLLYGVMNEVADLGSRRVDSALKALTTDATISINRKGLPIIYMDNYLLLAITTNQQNIGGIDEWSRRALVLPCIEKGSVHSHQLLKMWEKLIAEGFFTWYNSQPAKEALMYYFMNYDVGLYNGTQPPAVTDGKRLMAEDNISNGARYCREYLEDIMVIAPGKEYDLFRAMYQDNRTTRVQFNGDLKHNGFVGAGDKTKHQINFIGVPAIREALGTERPVVFIKEKAQDLSKEQIGAMLVNRYSRGKV